jgi:uncharacterized protein
MMTSALYIGTVGHVRMQPFRHAFTYRIFSLLLDLDEIALLARRIPIFGHNRFNLLSFHGADHGDGQSDPKAWVLAQLQAAGYAPTDHWQIKLLCFPRVLGFVFNPLAIYFCADETGKCRALLHQVSNTFGERHSYLLPASGTGSIVQACAKSFHVSPFMPVDGGYRFKVAIPGEKLSVAIHYHGPDGTDRLIATQQGQRLPLTNRTLIQAFLGHPLMTAKIVGGIHWEALKLWRKGAPFFRKPAPPPRTISAPTFSIAESIT